MDWLRALGLIASVGQKTHTSYNSTIVTLNAHFDGKAIVLDEPSSLPLRAGMRLKVRVELVEESAGATTRPARLEPLNIQIDPQLSNMIASDPRFDIEES